MAALRYYKITSCLNQRIEIYISSPPDFQRSVSLERKRLYGHFGSQFFTIVSIFKPVRRARSETQTGAFAIVRRVMEELDMHSIFLAAPHIVRPMIFNGRK